MRVKDAFRILIERYNRSGRDWERYHVPIFKSFAITVVDITHIKPGCKVLDVGTGTGLAAFLAASRVEESGSVVGIDIAEGMLRIAIEKSKRLGIGNLSFRVMDVLNLRFPSKSFDIVISNFGLPLFERKAFSEIHKVMRNGGRLSFNVWDSKKTEADKTFQRVFSKYKVSQPSSSLENFRKAGDLLSKMMEKYESHPTQIIGLLEEAGFHNIDMTKRTHNIIIPSTQTYLQMMLSVDYAREFSEMTPDVRNRFQEKVIADLEGLVSSEGLIMNYEVNYFMGIR